MNKTCYLLFALALAISATASIAYPKPVGADIVFHLEVVKDYQQGKNGMFADIVMEVNRIPYPPFFHLLLLPSAILRLENYFIRLLQALLYPLCLLFAMKLADKYGEGESQAVIVGLALLGSLAYLDATFQIRPETFDILFWLILVYATLTFRNKLGIASVIAGIYNHSFASLAFNGGILLFKKNWKHILIIALVGLPIITISFYYMFDMFGKWFMLPASEQAKAFLQNWPNFTLSYLGGLTIGLPIAFYYAYNWKSLSTLSKLSIVTILTSLIMVPIWYDRYYHYISIPLAFLISDFTIKCGGWKKLYITSALIFFFVLTYGSLWIANIYGFWDIH